MIVRPVRSVCARDHQRHDQGDLDQRYRKRQHQGAVRLADPVRDPLGMMDRGEHAGRERQGDDDHEYSTARNAQYGGQQYRHRKQRSDNRPQGNLSAKFHGNPVFSQVFINRSGLQRK
jgi:hypothetical protein